MKLLPSCVSMLVALFVLLVPSAKAKYALNSDGSYWVNPFTGKRNMDDSFTSLCEVSTNIVELPNDIYEYRPSFYLEVQCIGGADSGQQSCAKADYQCQQLFTTIHIVKATTEDALRNCWQYETREIPYGCSCMKSSEFEFV